jgi:hypothetical protein
MKKTVGKSILGVLALFILITGSVFVLLPERAAAKLLLDPQGAEGLSNLRGLAGAPLVGVGLSLMIAAITEKLEHARAAAIFLLCLITARLLSYGIDGPIDSIGLFLAVPVTVLGLMIVAHKLIDSEPHAAA